MALPLRSNVVTFQPTSVADPRIVIEPQGAIEIVGGLQPGTFNARVAASELEKLSSTGPGLFGSVELWWTTAVGDEPDVELAFYTISAIEPLERGSVAEGDGESVIAWSVTFSDFRAAFVEPRGGRLLDGRGNRDDGAVEATNSELIEACLDAMGVSVSVPSSVDIAPPARNLDWTGAHAPTELARLLEHVGHVYAPQSAGLGAIVRPGTGSVPAPAGPSLIGSLVVPAVDKRPLKCVVLLDGDAGRVDSFDADAGGGAPVWRYAVQDPADQMRWKLLADMTVLGADAATILANWRKGFPDAPAEHREHFKRQAFRCIMIEPDSIDATQAKLLPEVAELDGTTSAPRLELDDSVVRVDGRWRKRKTTFRPRSVDVDFNVMVFDDLIGGMTPTESSAIERDFTPWAAGSIKPTYSVEGWDAGSESKTYGIFGFTLLTLTPSPVSEATARSWLSGYRWDTAVWRMTGSRQVSWNLTSDNRSTIEAEAQDYAEAMLAGTALTPRRMEVAGYYAANLNGRVSRISYEWPAGRTVLFIDQWGQAGRGAQRQYRKPGRVRDSFEGAPDPAPEPLPPPLVVKVVAKKTGQAGRYDGRTRSVKLPDNPTGNLALADFGNVAAADDVELWHAPDVLFGEHSLQVGTNNIYTADVLGRNATTGKLIALVRTVPDVFVVDLEQTGGSAGTAATAATFTYTVKRRGTTIATGQTITMQRPKGRAIAAHLGLMLFADDGVKKVIWCDEVPDTGAC